MKTLILLVLFLPLFIGLIALAASRFLAHRRQKRAVNANQKEQDSCSIASVEKQIERIMRNATLAPKNSQQEAALIAKAMILKRTITNGYPGEIDKLSAREHSKICLEALREQERYHQQCELANA